MSRRPAILTPILLAALPLMAAPYEIDPNESLFAVVTRRAGFASGLAHDHLIAATDYSARLDFEKEAEKDVRFRFEVRAESLVPDEPGLAARWQQRLIELGLLDEEFGDVSDGQRKKIRRAMLGNDQLGAGSHPVIRASIAGVAPDGTTPGFDYRVRLKVEVRGVTVVRPVAARYERGDRGRLTIEAFGPFRFSDFGIEPYSAMLGAVRNRDDFHLYVHVVADVVETEPAPSFDGQKTGNP